MTTKKIHNLSLQAVHDMADENHEEFLGDSLLMVMSTARLSKQIVQIGQPYRIDAGRVIRVTSGRSHNIINMELHVLQEGMVLVVPSGSVFEIEQMDDAFDMQFVSFRDLQAEKMFQSCVELHLNDDDWHLTGEYFRLLSHTVNREPLNIDAVRSLQTALLSELQRIYDKDVVSRQKFSSRRQEVFHRFISQLNKHAAKEHNIAFYANKLCLTPNHLGATIREASGLTVMQWIHRHIIQQAKLQLRYTNLPIWQIAEELNFDNPSFFSKFFKRETGITPGEYRSNDYLYS